MSNLEIYNNAFTESMGLPLESVQQAKRGETAKWDSIGHMSLVAILEEEFSIELEPEDILRFDSYCAGTELLGRYGIKMEAADEEDR